MAKLKLPNIDDVVAIDIHTHAEEPCGMHGDDGYDDFQAQMADYFKSHNMKYTPISIKSDAEGKQQFLAGACDAYTTDASGLAALRATFEAPQDFVILPEIISKEPLGPVVEGLAPALGVVRGIRFVAGGSGWRVRSGPLQ